MPLNALNLIYCKFHIAQIIIIEDINNIIKGALEVFLSVVHFQHLFVFRQTTLDQRPSGKDAGTFNFVLILLPGNLFQLQCFNTKLPGTYTFPLYPTK